MPNVVASIRAQVQSAHPGAVVHSRGRNWIKHQQGDLFVFDTVIGSLHYHDGADWQEIDTDWRDSDDPDFTDRADRTHFKTYVRSNATRRVYPRRDVATEYIEFGLLEYWQASGGGRWRTLPQGVKNRAADRLTFDGTNVALSFIATPDQLKLSFVLKTSAAPTRARWPVTLVGLTLDANWNLASTTDQSIVARLPAPFMADAAGVERAVSATYAGGYIEYNADVAGLSYPIDIDPTIDAQVGASSDDGMETAGNAPDLTATTLRWGATASGSHVVGARFTGITITAGATIDVAYLSAYFYSGTADDISATLYAHDDGAPGTFTTDDANIDGRTRTTASVAWSAADVLGGGAAAWVNSPSIVSIIEELLASYTYSSGAIAILSVGAGSQTEGGTSRSYDQTGNTLGPKLHIEYTAQSGEVLPAPSSLITGTPQLDNPIFGQVSNLTARNLEIGTPIFQNIFLNIKTYTDGYDGDVNSADDALMALWTTGYNNGGAHADLAIASSQRCLLRFDLSAIPANASCYTAKLYLYHSYDPEPAGEKTISVYSVSEANGDWVAGTKDIAPASAGECCWNAKAADGAGGIQAAWAGTAGLGTAGTDYESAAIGTKVFDFGSAKGTECVIDLNAERVGGWFGTPNTNYGIVMWGTGAGDGHFSQADGVTTAYRPKLVVQYSTTGGVVSYSFTANNLPVSAPVYTTPILLQSYYFVSIGVVTASPSFAVLTFIQKQEFLANVLTTGPPIFGTPDLKQNYIFNGFSIVTGSIILENPNLEQEHNFTGNGIINSNPILGCPDLTIGSLTFSGNNLISDTPVLGNPSINQTRNLVADNLISGYPIFGKPDMLVGSVILTASNLISGAPILGNLGIWQTHVLQANGLLVSSPILGSPEFAQRQDFVANGLATRNPVLGNPNILIGVKIFNGNGLVAEIPIVGNPTLGQIHSLQSIDFVASAHVLGNPVLGQTHPFTAKDLVTGSPIFENPSTSGAIALSVIGLVAGSPVLGSPDLSVTSVEVYGTNNLIIGSPILGNPEIGQVHILSAYDLRTGSPVLGNPALPVESGSLVVVPIERTYMVFEENRVYQIYKENRIYFVER